MLTCENLSYKKQFAGLGFSVIPGALMALLGDKAATSTLLAMLADKMKISGQVRFEGQPVHKSVDYKELLQYHPYPLRLPRPRDTVQQAVKNLADIKAGGAPELAEAAMRYFGLPLVRDRPCGGMPEALQRRVALTPLLTLPRPIWLLDRVDEGLDAEALGMLDALIANRCNQDGIVIVATARRGFMTPLPCLELSDFPAPSGFRG